MHWSAKFLVKDITTLCSHFSNFSFVWTRRKAIRFAHLVGKWAVNNCFAGSVNVSCLPSSVVSQLIQDSESRTAT